MGLKVSDNYSSSNIIKKYYLYETFRPKSTNTPNPATHEHTHYESDDNSDNDEADDDSAPPPQQTTPTISDNPDSDEADDDSALPPRQTTPTTSDWQDTLSLARAIAKFSPISAHMELVYNQDAIRTWITDASTYLSLDTVYDEALFDSLDLKDLTTSDYATNDQQLRDMGLDSTLELHLSSLRLRGEKPPRLRQIFKRTSSKHKAIDILSNGQRKFMKNEFKPNGFKEVSQTQSYRTMRRVCNHAMKKLIDQQKCIAFSKDALIETNEIEHLHGSPLAWAPKWKKVEGRTCLHASKKSKHFPSLNDSVDREKHDLFYPPMELPSLCDIAEMACEQRDHFPGEELSGANVDVTAAYTQGPQSAATAKLHTTQLSVLSETKKWITIIVIYLVGIFGFTRAGHVYCTFASTIDEAHNEGQPTRRSRTYIDDGILISPERLIDDSLEAYVAFVVALFGLDGANKEKIKKWHDRVEAIGWVLDLRTWLATPKKKGLDKMLVYLFDRIPPGTRTATTKDIERLVGLLSWYTPGIPAGSSFLGSLFACKSRGSYKVKLSPLAVHDLNWW